MTKQTFTGKTLDEALDAAATHFGVNRSAVSYESQTSGGGLLSKLFSRSIKIEAWVEESKDLKQAARDAVKMALSKEHSNKEAAQQNKGEPRYNTAPKNNKKPAQQQNNQRPPRPAQQQPKEPREPREPKQPREPKPPREPRPERPVFHFDSPGVKDVFDEFAERFTQTFGAATEKVEKLPDGQMFVKLNDSFLEDALSKSDKLSVAFEHVFKRIAQKKIGDVADRIVLEAGSSAERREVHLKETALSIAEKVRRTGRAVTLASRSGAERRVIHLSLDGQEGVATKSVGMGEDRKLIIFSTNPEHKQQKRRPHQNENGGVNAGAAEGQNTEGGAPRRPRRNRNRRNRNNNERTPPANV